MFENISYVYMPYVYTIKFQYTMCMHRRINLQYLHLKKYLALSLMLEKQYSHSFSPLYNGTNNVHNTTCFLSLISARSARKLPTFHTHPPSEIFLIAVITLGVNNWKNYLLPVGFAYMPFNFLPVRTYKN